VISGKTGTVASKMEAFSEAGVPVADSPGDVSELVKDLL